jgi:hypothetical protein
MFKKNNSAFVWRAVFTIAYTLVVLPFTTNLFKNIASPSQSQPMNLFTVIPLIDVHNFALPIFLSALEFASIGLACSLWKKRQATNNLLILLLFLGCQLLPMASLYYDIRTKDYLNERKMTEESKKEIVESLNSRIMSLKEQIQDTSNDLQEARRERGKINMGIDQLLHKQNIQDLDIEKGRSEFIDRRQQREKLWSMSNSLFMDKKSLKDELKKKEADLESYIHSQVESVKHKSELEYIVSKFLTPKSAFAGFIAFLFPLTLLAVAFVLPKNSKADAEVFNSFSLEHHLRNAASLPEDMHYNYIRLLVPSIDAYVSALRASKTILNENDALNLHNTLIRQIISEVKGLQGQIASSKLEENAKSYLLNEINNILNQQLLGKEAMSHG